MPRFRRFISAVLKRTDHRRWTAAASFSEGWDGRNEIIAGMIHPRSRVLELGAGAGRLAAILPSDCLYTGADLNARNSETVVCDLNRRPIPIRGVFDVVIFSGVLEYLVDCDRVIGHFSRLSPQIIASYAVRRGPLVGSYWQRRNHGWLNDFSEDEFYGLFAGHDLKPAERKDWQSQLVVRFQK
jgi:hypothetical protein